MSNNCFACSEIISGENDALLCDKCIKEDDDLQAVKSYAEEHLSASPEEIEEKTGVSARKARWILNGTDVNDKADLTVDTKVYGDSHMVVFAGGKVDSLNSTILQRVIDSALDDGWTNIALNVREVSFFSSAAIRVAVSAYKKAVSLGGGFFLTEAGKNVKNILAMTALDKTLLK